MKSHDFIKQFFISACALALTMALISADMTPQERYIDRFASLAVSEMYRSGVPASITLAQGLLESRYGLSALAAEGHNHFGIKCHNDWKGKSMKVDDDLKGECFRVYDEDIQSFQDHSDFLRYRDRYKFLFDYKITDYKSWAYGLSKAGYATDPSYPAKLIKLIEEYDLGKYDRAKRPDFEPGGKYASMHDDSVLADKEEKALDERAVYPGQRAQTDTKQTGHEESKAEKRARLKAEKQARLKARQKRINSVKTEREPDVVPAAEEDVIPESPGALEEVEVFESQPGEEFHFSTYRKVYKQNGVPFIYSMEDENYASIAEENNIMYKQLLRYNDLDSDRKLLPGTVVYLQSKKNQTRKGLDKYIVETDGETLRDICQRFAVKESSIMKINGFTAGHELREGDTVILRK